MSEWPARLSGKEGEGWFLSFPNDQQGAKIKNQ